MLSLNTSVGKSKRFALLSLGLAVALVAPTFADPPEELFPTFKNDREKAAYFLWLDETYPTLLDHRTSYETDLFGLLDKEANVRAQLAAMGKLTRRTSGSILTIYAATKTTAPASIQAGKPFFWSAELRAQWLAYLKTGGYRGAIVGLVNLLPPADRKTVFSLPTGDVLRTLVEKLPENVVAAGFNPKAYGFEAIAHDKVRLIDAIGERVAEEDRILTKASGEMVAFATEQRVVIRDEVFKVWFDEALANFGAPAHELKPMEEFRKGLKKSMTASGVYGDAHVVLTEERKVVMRLREVPAHVGVFRGWAGGDCSSSFSFAYPWSPQERVFFVYDHEDRIKGYLAGKVLNSNAGTNEFYLHSINGKISEDDTVLLLKAVNEGRENLGISRILIPATDRVHSMVNYEPIRSAYAKFRNEAHLVNLQYIDVAERNYLDTVVTSSSYDSAKSNLRAYYLSDEQEKAIKAPLANGAELKVDKDFYRWMPAHTDRINPAQLYLQKTVSVQTSNAYLQEKVGKFLVLDPAEERAWNAIFLNEKKLPYDQYQTEIKEWFQKTGLKFEDFQQRIEPILLTGMGRSPDVFSGPTGRRRRLKVIGFLNEPVLNPKAAILIHAHAAEFEDSDVERIVRLALVENERVFDQAKLDGILSAHPRARTRFDQLFGNSDGVSLSAFETRRQEWLAAQSLDSNLFENLLRTTIDHGELRAADFFTGANGALRLNAVADAIVNSATRSETILKLGSHFDRLGNAGYDRILTAAIAGAPEVNMALVNAHPSLAKRYAEVFGNAEGRSYSAFTAALAEWKRANQIPEAVWNAAEFRRQRMQGVARAPDAFTGTAGLGRFREMIPEMKDPSIAQTIFDAVIAKVGDQLTFDDALSILKAMGNVVTPGDLAGPELSRLLGGDRGTSFIRRLGEAMRARGGEADRWLKNRVAVSSTPTLDQAILFAFRDQVSSETIAAQNIRYWNATRYAPGIGGDAAFLFTKDHFATADGLQRLRRYAKELSSTSLPAFAEMPNLKIGRFAAFSSDEPAKFYRTLLSEFSANWTILTPPNRFRTAEVLFRVAPDAKSFMETLEALGDVVVQDAARGGAAVKLRAWAAEKTYARLVELRPRVDQIETLAGFIPGTASAAVYEEFARTFAVRCQTEKEFDALAKALKNFRAKMGDRYDSLFASERQRVRMNRNASPYYAEPLGWAARCGNWLKSLF